jgi:PIN domain nuclease of toxin-antitoxin system
MPSGEMKQSILLDTCAAVFLVAEQLKTVAREALEDADRNGSAIYVSPITAWEIGMLVSRNRLVLTTSPELWFAAIVRSGIKLVEMGPDVLIASSFLPSSDLRDPADRILAATARLYGHRLMTRDRPLLDYASQGHLNAIAC